MRPAKQPPTSRGRDRHVLAIVVVPDTVALEIAVAQQVFGRRMPSLAAVTGDGETPYEVVLVGEQPRVVLPSGTDPGELAPLDTLLTADTVLVPGLEEPLAERSPELLAALRAARDAGARMVSFCGGAFILGRAGILDGKRATTHWVLSKEFREEFPLATLQAEHLYVDDGEVHTSGGIFSATDLALHLLSLDLGHAYANDLSRILVSAPHRPGGQAQFMKDSIRLDAEPPVESFLRWLREHLDEPLTLAQLAAHEHVSERTLVRKFRADTGMSVFDWITRERVNQAKALLETTDHPVSEIAAMVGLGTSESLRRQFERLVGTSASAYRKTFRGALVTA
ncbi:helix-turn-helix domain-containing protein [Agromyces sp. G08B096]|uniref:Helix-turn-helix domain-containing protein n=1 Tax=Agromyces sp. G08B096 TaxID=3156399 RepID=A0AAU7W8F2_9MICO